MARRKDPRGQAGRRVAVALAVGVVVLAAALGAGANWAVAVTGAWGSTALLIAVSVWVRIARMDAEHTRANARAEDLSRATADLVVLCASVASLVAVAFTLVQARHHGGVEKGALIVLAIVAVALSWATVQTIYTLRYGDLFYSSPEGGVDFNESDPPDYRDFAYLALTLGMTFQVSDTNLTSKAMRRTATHHALLSFLFAAVILALAINTVASLLQ